MLSVVVMNGRHMATQAGKATDTLIKLRDRARGQIFMLSAQFLLGMGVNLIGLPSDTSGTAKTTTQILLGLHVLISLGLLVGAGISLRLARKAGEPFVRLAWIGATGIAITVTAGILTAATKSNWWSYLMALGFMASLLLYGAVFTRATHK